MTNINILKRLLRTSYNNIKCIFRGHIISEEDEDELFDDSPTGILNTMCQRCRYPLRLERDNLKWNTYNIIED